MMLCGMVHLGQAPDTSRCLMHGGPYIAKPCSCHVGDSQVMGSSAAGPAAPGGVHSQGQVALQALCVL